MRSSPPHFYCSIDCFGISNTALSFHLIWRPIVSDHSFLSLLRARASIIIMHLSTSIHYIAHMVLFGFSNVKGQKASLNLLNLCLVFSCLVYYWHLHLFVFVCLLWRTDGIVAIKNCYEKLNVYDPLLIHAVIYAPYSSCFVPISSTGSGDITIVINSKTTITARKFFLGRNNRRHASFSLTQMSSLQLYLHPFHFIKIICYSYYFQRTQYTLVIQFFQVLDKTMMDSLNAPRKL